MIVGGVGGREGVDAEMRIAFERSRDEEEVRTAQRDNVDQPSANVDLLVCGVSSV